MYVAEMYVDKIPLHVMSVENIDEMPLDKVDEMSVDNLLLDQMSENKRYL